MRIKFITYQGLELLKSNLSKNTALFSKETPEALLKKIGNNALVDTGFECKPFNLVISNNPDDDFENVKRVYTVLKDVLTDSSASDERIWLGFALKDQCWKYINARWKKGGWTASTLKDRVFYGQHPRTRNAIGRLYWIGRMTYDQANKEDPWHYTRFICSNQRYIEDILGRNMANNLVLIKACADACEQFEKDNPGKKVDSNKMRDLQKYMSILGATYVLDAIDGKILAVKIKNKAKSLFPETCADKNHELLKVKDETAPQQNNQSQQSKVSQKAHGIEPLVQSVPKDQVEGETEIKQHADSIAIQSKQNQSVISGIKTESSPMAVSSSVDENNHTSKRVKKTKERITDIDSSYIGKKVYLMVERCYATVIAVDKKSVTFSAQMIDGRTKSVVYYLSDCRKFNLVYMA